MDNETARGLMLGCFQAGLAAVEPEAAVARGLSPVSGRVVVFALGKAAPAMARGAARALGRPELEGIVVTNHRDVIPGGLELIVGDHPVPGAGSLAAGEAVLALAATLGSADTAVVLVSGGGSALVEAPIEGVSLDDLAATSEALLVAGADIYAINTVRRRLSRIKGGGLAAVLAPAQLTTFIVSDVVGDDPATIASGPTVPAADPAGAALEVVSRFRLAESLPPAVVAALNAPSPQPAIAMNHDVRVIANGATAAHAAAAEAERRGVPARVLDTRIGGDAGAMVGEALARAGFGMSVFAGETTVRVVGDGVGGRNHEAALVAATLLDGSAGGWFLAAGTDGIDGATTAAGTVVDGGTASRARAIGLDADRALERNDSGSFFAALGEQIITGPTGTNVGDLWLVLRD